MRVLVGTADIDIDWLLSPSKGPMRIRSNEYTHVEYGPRRGPGAVDEGSSSPYTRRHHARHGQHQHACTCIDDTPPSLVVREAVVLELGRGQLGLQRLRRVELRRPGFPPRFPFHKQRCCIYCTARCKVTERRRRAITRPSPPPTRPRRAPPPPPRPPRQPPPPPHAASPRARAPAAACASSMLLSVHCQLQHAQRVGVRAGGQSCTCNTGYIGHQAGRLCGCAAEMLL